VVSCRFLVVGHGNALGSPDRRPRTRSGIRCRCRMVRSPRKASFLQGMWSCQRPVHRGDAAESLPASIRPGGSRRWSSTHEKHGARATRQQQHSTHDRSGAQAPNFEFASNRTFCRRKERRVNALSIFVSLLLCRKRHRQRALHGDQILHRAVLNRVFRSLTTRSCDNGSTQPQSGPVWPSCQGLLIGQFRPWARVLESQTVWVSGPQRRSLL